MIPDGAALARDAFRPARARALEHRRRMPIGEAAWQSGVALGALRRAAALARRGRDRPRPAGRAARAAGPGPARRHPRAARRRGDRPGAHARAAHLALGAPRPAPVPAPLPARQRARPGRARLGAEPARDRPARLRGPPPPGRRRSSTRRTARASARATARSTPGASEADEVVERVFAEFLEQYPLAGGAVRDEERERVRRDVHELLAYDWEHGGPPLRGRGAHLRPPGAARAAARRPLALRARPDRSHRRRRRA